MSTFVKEEGEDMISPTSPPPPTPPCLLPLKTPHHFLSILPSICGIQTMEWNAAPRLKYKRKNNSTDFLQKQNIYCLAECWCNVKQCKGKVICCTFFVFSSKFLMSSCNEVAKQEAGAAYIMPSRQYQSAVMLTGQLCPHHHYSPIYFWMVDLSTCLL